MRGVFLPVMGGMQCINCVSAVNQLDQWSAMRHIDSKLHSMTIHQHDSIEAVLDSLIIYYIMQVS